MADDLRVRIPGATGAGHSLRLLELLRLPQTIRAKEQRTMATRVATQQKTDVQGQLDGKTAVITGAGRGIGKAIATAFARAGACSIFVVRDRELGEALAEEQRTQGYTADCGVADVTDASQISMLVLDLMQRHPVIDVLVNNAGIFLDADRHMRPSESDPLIMEETWNTNVLGVVRMCSAFIPHMPKGGRIINVSSTMGQLAGEPQARGPAYSTSKAALNMYTQMLAADLSDRNIMVDSFHPGWVKTDMGGPRATVEPEDAAKTALFLAARPHSTETGLFWKGTTPTEW
ncbi:MAG: SDR family NAD(P)-dependent oxidoreductase [Candidatus Eremiobacteraeota bacterium]|nr:SDR family NAD(P)-dependent oxidoreductase [Candidatus Eremiobacteraeota bacterium]